MTDDERSAQSDVYCLVDDKGRPKYVGVTVDLTTRMHGHASGAHRHNPQLAQWLASLGSTPAYIVLDRVPYEDRLQVESYFVAGFKWAGVALLNMPVTARVAGDVVTLRATRARGNIRYITWRGHTMDAKQWAAVLGLAYSSFLGRVRNPAWTLRRAMSQGIDEKVLAALGEDDSDPIMRRGMQ